MWYDKEDIWLLGNRSTSDKNDAPSGGGVYVDEDEQQQVEHDAKNTEHSQESLLWWSHVWAHQLHE